MNQKAIEAVCGRGQFYFIVNSEGDEYVAKLVVKDGRELVTPAFPSLEESLEAINTHLHNRGRLDR